MVSQDVANEMVEALNDIRDMKVALDTKVHAFNSYYGRILKKHNDDKEKRRLRELEIAKEEKKQARAKAKSSKSKVGAQAKSKASRK